ncbi:MAG: SpoVR family protein [Candidatus Pacebacteria bacterium]|nr:SpoVR family protein [Candidatus Paceibacterota bacterium]
MSKLLFRCGQPWTEQMLRDTLDACLEIAYNDLGLDLYPNQVIVCSERGMLDFLITGSPHSYPHWSFGKRAMGLQHERLNGEGLAFEVVIGTNPCMSWNMASNTAAEMALVLAHAAVGHNHFFKNNHLYRKHMDAEGFADYSMKARDMILDFEHRFGIQAVEEVLDACHALAYPCGLFRDGPPEPFDAEREKKRIAQYMRELEQSFDASLAETAPATAKLMQRRMELPEKGITYPQENVLFFVEQYAPKLKSWQREVVRLVRTLHQQTMVPGVQTRVMNEGMAVFTHNYIVRRLYDDERIDDGTFLEMIRSNTNVIKQPLTKDVGALVPLKNPYTIGYRIMQEIVRVVGMPEDDKAFFKGWIDTEGPTAEDKQFLPFLAGKKNWREAIKDAVANYNDPSFIQQFMTPRLIRELGLFKTMDMGEYLLVTDVSDEFGYENIRLAVAREHSFEGALPHIAVVKADLDGDRKLTLEHKRYNDIELDKLDAERTVTLLEKLWGYKVDLKAA